MANPGSVGYQKTGALGVRLGGTGLRSLPKGSVLFAIEPNVFRALAPGSNTEVLTLAAGLPSWAAAAGGGAPDAHNLIDTTGHPVSGLTTGHFIRATGSTTYAFAAIALGDLPAIAFADLSDYPADATGFLENDGAGTLTWGTPAGGGTVSGTGTENVLPKWSSGGANIEDSALLDTGSVLTYGGASFSIDTLAWLVDDVTIGFGYTGVWFHEATPSGVNYNLAGNGAHFIINGQASGNIEFRINNVVIGTVDVSRLSLTQELRLVDGVTTTLSGALVSGYGGLWLDATSPGTGNYTLLDNGTSETLLNAVAGATVKMRVNNTDIAIFAPTGMTMVNGLEATPGYGFTGDPGNGMFLGGANILAWSTAAVERMELTTGSLNAAADAGLTLGTAALKWGSAWMGVTEVSTLTGIGGRYHNTTVESSSTTLDTTDHTVYVTAAGGDVTVSLPATPLDGQEILVVLTASDGSDAIVGRNTKNIDDAASDLTIAGVASHLRLIYDANSLSWWTV